MMNFRIHSNSLWLRPWSRRGVMLALFATVNCGGMPADGGGGGPGVGGQAAGGTWFGTGGVGGTWGTGGYAVGGTWAGTGGQAAGGTWPGVGGGSIGGSAGEAPAGGSWGAGGASVHDRQGCEQRQSECFLAVEALCAVLESYDCEYLVEQCISAHDECQQNWIATCPRGVSECYSRAELCYSSGLPLDVCDEIFVSCGEEARVCLDAISPEEPELPEEELQFLRESAATG